jgi:hypothetical protein
MLQPMITRGIKIKTTLGTSTPAITAAMSPIPATMATTPKTFSPIRRTDVSYPRTTQLRGGCLIYFHRDVHLRPMPDEGKTDEETIA